MANNNFWANNIKFLRQRRKLSQDTLATLLNITRAKLNGHENGVTKNPGIEDLISFSDYFKISIDHLLRTNLKMVSELQLQELEQTSKAYTTGMKMRVLATTVTPENNENIEMVPLKAKAGYTSGYGDPDFIATLPTFTLPHLPQNRKYRMFPITGDSMLPVPEGAFVIAEYITDWHSIKPFTPCIVITQDDGIVFKMVTINGEENALLQSLNPIYNPYEVSLSDVLEIWQFRSMVSDHLPELEISTQQIASALQDIKKDILLIKPLLTKDNSA